MQLKQGLSLRDTAAEDGLRLPLHPLLLSFFLFSGLFSLYPHLPPFSFANFFMALSQTNTPSVVLSVCARARVCVDRNTNTALQDNKRGCSQTFLLSHKDPTVPWSSRLLGHTRPPSPCTHHSNSISPHWRFKSLKWHTNS